MKYIFCLTLLLISQLGWTTSYTWNGTSSDWATSTNWTPNGVPTTGDAVTINGTGSVNPILDQNRTIASLNFSIKTLDLNVFTLTVAGATTCSSGSINNGILTLSTTTGTATFSGTTLGSTLNGSAALIYLNGSIFNGPVDLTKTGTTQVNSNGGNTFNNSVSLTLALGAGPWVQAMANKDIFNSTITITNLSASSLNFAQWYNTDFNDDIIINQSTTGVIYFGSTGTCSLAVNKTIKSGTNGGFTNGTLWMKNFVYNGTTPFNLSTSGTINFLTGCIFNCPITLTAGYVLFNGATFNDAVTITKTGSGSNTCTGGNIFNGPLKITNTINATFIMSQTARDIYNSSLTIVNNSPSTIYIGYGSTSPTLLNDNVYVNQSGSGYIYFGYSSACSLAVGKTISSGTDGGLTNGYLYLKNFTQLGTTPQSISTTASIFIGPGSQFNGNLTFSATRLFLNGAVYNGNVDFTQSGTVATSCDGGNVFNAPASLSNTGTAQWNIAVVNSDIYNYPLTLNNSSAGILVLANNSYTIQILDNLVLNETGTGSIRLGTTLKPITLTSGKTVTLSNSSSVPGLILFTGINFPSGSPLNLDVGCTGWLKFISCTFASDVNVRTGFGDLQNNKFNAAFTYEKCGGSGGTSDNVYGGNVYYGLTTFIDSGLGSLSLGYTSPDIYNNDVTFTSSNSSYIYPNSIANGTQYNGNIILNKTAGNYGFYFGNGANAYATLAAGKTISFGSTSDNSPWVLNLFKLHQLGSTPQNLLTGTAHPGIFQIIQCTFEGPIYIKCGNLALQQNTFGVAGNSSGGSGKFERNGGGGVYDWSPGGNIYNYPVELINTGTAGWVHASAYPDVYNGDVTVTCATNGIYLAHNIAGNQFNGNINLNVSSSGFLYIGQGANATATLASGKTIQAGNLGFSGGTIYVQRLTQVGSSSIILSPTGTTAIIQFGANNNLLGDLTLNAPQVIFLGTGSVYSGIVSATITGGTTTVTWSGSSQFNNDVTVNLTSTTASLNLCGATSDSFKFYGNASFNRNSTNQNLMVNAYGICEFYKNVTYNYTGSYTASWVPVYSTWPYCFGYAGGTTKFLGSNPQTISSNKSDLYFFNIFIDKPQNGITITTSINMVPSPYPAVIPPTLTLNNGNIICSSGSRVRLSNLDANGNIITIPANKPILVGGSSKSFVDGQFVRIGTYAFTFPVGKNGEFMPISMDTPSSSSVYQIEAFSGTPPNSSNLGPGVSKLSNCQYWNYTNAGSPAGRKLTLNWNANTCTTVIPTSVKVAEFNGTQWVDVGANNLVNNYPSGSITTNTLTSYGYITFSSSQASDITYAKLQKELDGGYYQVGANGLLWFKFDEEYFVVSGNYLNYKIYNRSNSDVTPAAIQTVKYGDNRYSLDLSSLSSPAYYVLEVSNQKGEKWYLRFKKN